MFLRVFGPWRKLHVMIRNGARRFVFLLMKALPTFWVTRILILTIPMCGCVFPDSKFPDSQTPKFLEFRISNRAGVGGSSPELLSLGVNSLCGSASLYSVYVHRICLTLCLGSTRRCHFFFRKMAPVFLKDAWKSRGSATLGFSGCFFEVRPWRPYQRDLRPRKVLYLRMSSTWLQNGLLLKLYGPERILSLRHSGRWVI